MQISRASELSTLLNWLSLNRLIENIHISMADLLTPKYIYYGWAHGT